MLGSVQPPNTADHHQNIEVCHFAPKREIVVVLQTVVPLRHHLVKCVFCSTSLASHPLPPCETLLVSSSRATYLGNGRRSRRQRRAESGNCRPSQSTSVWIHLLRSFPGRHRNRRQITLEFLAVFGESAGARHRAEGLVQVQAALKFVCRCPSASGFHFQSLSNNRKTCIVGHFQTSRTRGFPHEHDGIINHENQRLDFRIRA
ncbi:hypothetical protein QBC45DRAFT_242989 [Copromyces sp. CBS 386.78]|nr:hypothetical protein QBC45DRAFT_242989 [Copromyces sp. CBS 386.78]